MQTALCRRLGIAHPVIQAPMNWATDARLVAAVGEGGGLGTLGPNAGIRSPIAEPEAMAEQLRAQIREVRRRTARSFAVNLPVGRGEGRRYSDATARVVVEEQVPIVIVVTGSPEIYTSSLKAAGIFVMHAVSSVAHAVKACAAGVDAVIAEGFEAGGHTGHAELPMAVLVPQVVDAVDIPVVAAGGITEARGLLMGLIAGAQAVYMGTRFMAAEESPIHDRVKQAIVDAGDLATISWGRRIGVARTLANSFAKTLRENEENGASPEALHQFIESYSGSVNRRVGGLLEGDLDNGEIYLGAGAGLIDSILPAAEIIVRTMRDAHVLVGTLSHAFAQVNDSG